jgi:hypothetical protein
MNNNKISNLAEPSNGQDSATVNYVNLRGKRCYSGYIPILLENNDISGFMVSASSEANSAFRAFSNHLDEWLPSETSGDSWIKIQPPEETKVWQIRLRANNATRSGFKFEGSVDNTTFTTIIDGSSSVLDNSTRTHSCENNTAYYNIYKLICIGTEGRKPRLSYFQIFVHSS